MGGTAQTLKFNLVEPLLEEIRKTKPLTDSAISRAIGRSSGFLSQARREGRIHRESELALRALRDELNGEAGADPATVAAGSDEDEALTDFDRQVLDAGGRILSPPTHWKERDGEAALEQAVQSLRELVERIDESSGAPLFTAAEHDRLEVVTHRAEKALERRKARQPGNGRLFPRDGRAAPIASDVAG